MHHDPNSEGTEPSGAESDTGRDIAARLHHRSRSIELGDTPVELVVRRGRQRQRRQRTAFGLLAVVGVCGSTIAAVNLLSRPTEHRIASSTPAGEGSATEASNGTTAPPAAGTTNDPTGVVASDSTINIVDSNLVWNLVDPDSSEAIGTMGSQVGSGPFVAWSTAAGQRPDQPWVPTLWRSDDGQSWQPVVNGPKSSGGSLSEYDGNFFAFGTSPSTASIPGAPTDLTLGTSSDGGITWTENAVPIDVSSLAGEAGVSSVNVSPIAMASGPHGVLVAARVSVNVDWEKVLPPEVYQLGWNITADGVEVYANSDCMGPETTVPGTALATIPPLNAITTPANAETTTTSTAAEVTTGTVSTTVVAPAGTSTATSMMSCGQSPATSSTIAPANQRLSWAQLGISPIAGAALWNPNLRMFLSPDASTFHEVTVPIVPEGFAISEMRIASVGGRFTVWTSAYGRTDGAPNSRLSETVDGITWTDAGPTPIPQPQSLDAAGDQLVMTGYEPTSNNTVVAIRNGAGDWRTVRLNDLTLPSDGKKVFFSAGSAAVGSTGITVIASMFVDPIAEAGGVEVTHDGVTLRAEDTSGTLTFLDASTGAEISRITGYDPSTSSLVQMSPTTGSYSVRRTVDGPTVATFTQEELGVAYNAANQPYTAPLYVLHSVDGVNWSREKLADIAGVPIGGSGGVRLTSSQVIVAANRSDQLNAAGAPKQLLLIGTPRA